MPKSKILQDSFEQLVELSQKTAKQTTKQVVQTFSPQKIVEQVGVNESSQTQHGEKLKQNNHTLLDTDALEKKYQGQDEQKMTALRNRLFQLGRQEEEKLLAEKKQERQQKEQQELREEQDKKRKEEEKKNQQEQSVAPRGKQRRSIFSPEKKATEQHVEIRPSAGKQ